MRPEDHSHAARRRVGEHLVDEGKVEGRERTVQVVLQALPLERDSQQIEPFAVKVVHLPGVGEALGVDAGIDVVDAVSAGQGATELTAAQVYPELLAQNGWCRRVDNPGTCNGELALADQHRNGRE
jgi:hypothetical protein